MAITKQRVVNKLKSVFERVVPYNYSLKPTGFYLNHADDNVPKDGTVHYHQVIPNCESTLTLPKRLFDSLSDYGVYDGATEETLRTAHDYVAVVCQNGRLFTNNTSIVAVVSEENKLLGDVSLNYSKDLPSNDPSINEIFKQKCFKTPEYIDGTVCTLLAGGGPARGNYAHWLIDVLPRIELLKKAGLFDSIDYFVVAGAKYDFHLDSLEALGVKKEQLINADGRHFHICAKSLVATSHPRGQASMLIPQWVNAFFDDLFKTKIDVAQSKLPEKFDKIYINRQDTSLRKVVNEDEVMELLESYGFKSFTMSEWSFFDKAKLFHNADYIVSIHSAGLGSLFFCKPHAKLLEIYSSGFVLTTYVNIALNQGMKYFFRILKVDGGATDMKAGIVEDVKIDLEELKSLLEESGL